MNRGQAGARVQRKGWGGWTSQVAWQTQQAQDVARQQEVLREVIHERKETHH